MAHEPGPLWLERLRFVARAARETETLLETKTRLESAQRIARLGAFEQDLASGSLWCSVETARLLGRDPGTCTSLENLLEATGVTILRLRARGRIGPSGVAEFSKRDVRFVISDGGSMTAKGQGRVSASQLVSDPANGGRGARSPSRTPAPS